MLTKVKLVLSLLLLCAFFFFICGVYLNYMLVQSISLLLLSLLLLSLKDEREWLSGFRLMGPFLLSLILIYCVFGILRVQTQEKEQGTLAYWLVFGGKRILLFVNSVLAIRLFFTLISFDDLLRLPLAIGVQKYVILGKMLYGSSFRSYSELIWHQRFFPSEQAEKLSLSHKFKARLSVVLGLLLLLVNDAREKGELIDNRIMHCHGVQRTGTGVWYLTLSFIVIVTVATMIIPIPIPGGGFFNFGDVMIVFVGLYAGKKAGALAGGIGSAIADLMLFPLFAPVTLLVKGCEGFLCGLGNQKQGLLRFVFPFIGCSFMVGGYFVGEWFMPQLGKAVAISDLPVNVIQASAGFIGGRALFEASKYLDLK